MLMKTASANRPRLLVVAPTYPYPLVSGGKQRIYHILRRLSQSFAVTLLTLAEPGDDTPAHRQALQFLDDLITVPIAQQRWSQAWRLLRNAHRRLSGVPAEVLVKYSAAMAHTLQRLITTRQFDIVQFEYLQTAQYLAPVAEAGLPTVLVAHDICTVTQQRRAKTERGIAGWLWSHEASAMQAYEHAIWPQVSRIVAVSEVDAQYIRSHLSTVPVQVVPNGVDTTYATPHPESGTPEIVFVGWMRHAPNRDALTWLLNEIWPRICASHPDVRLKVIGKAMPCHLAKQLARSPRVDYLGYLEDVREAVGRAWVSVVPLRVGSGSRLKILESMALGTPVVTTTVGCEGIDAKPGGHAVFADDATAFSAAVLKLLADADQRHALAARARDLVVAQYDWDALGRGAAAALTETLTARQGCQHQEEI